MTPEDIELLNNPVIEYDVLGKHYREFEHSFGLARLLIEEVCFVSGAGGMVYREGGGNGFCRIMVLCNDLFAYACADCEELPWDEVETLYNMEFGGHPAGSQKWCCLRRGMRPLPSREKKWRDLGWWDEELEALPPRSPKECG